MSDEGLFGGRCKFLQPAIAAALLFVLPSQVLAANPLHAVIEDFESGGTAGAVAVDASNSAATGASNTVIANVTDGGSKRLRLTDADGAFNGCAITFPNAIPQAGYYLITADLKVDNPSAIGTFGMAVTLGGTTTAKVTDVNAGYVMNLAGTGDGALGYQTIGAAIQVPSGGSFPQNLTIYFSTDPSSNTFNAPAGDGNFSGNHRLSTSTWAAGTSNAVYVDNIKRIGPGNFGEDRHLFISIGDAFTNLANLENILVQAKNNNFNAVDILIRYRANAFYVPNRTDSTFPNPEPFANSGGVLASATNDPFQYAIDRGHELGLKVYGVFSTLLMTDGHNNYPAFLPSGSQMWYYNAGAPRTMLASDPGAEGVWADPGRSDVRAYIKNIFMDVVRNYEMDGIIFDRLRYPQNGYSYNPQGLSEMGISGTPLPTDNNFKNARRDAVTALLADCYESATSEKPWLVVGTTPIVFADGFVDSYHQVFQFFPKWNGKLTANREVSFGVCDLFQPQAYRLATTAAPFTGPASNERIMNKCQFGDPPAFNMDFGLMPGAYGNCSPLLYHPNGADVNQSNCNAQNILDARGLYMNGAGLYAATRTLQDIGLIRSPSATPAGVDVFANPVPSSDYLFKKGFDNVKPNPARNFAAVAQPDGVVSLNWLSPLTAADGETADKYLIYRGTSAGVKEFRANLITPNGVPGTATSYDVPTDFAGTYYYKIVALDDYNNRSTAVEVGPVTATGEPVPPADVIVDNPAATFTGTWTTASSAGDKFGPNYRFKSAGSGAATATFTASVPLSGSWSVSEWHPAGSNRATNARHNVTHDGGTTLYTVNQTANGGKWNKIADLQFTSGNNYSVTIDDQFTGTVIMADAMRLSYNIVAPPAPTGLAATAVSQTAIALTWTDNAANERNYIIARSTSAGGPYEDIAALGINHSSFTDTGLNANTTYYYVVIAANSAGSSANSNEASATTHPFAPAAPGSLSATANGTSQINLSWADNSNNEANFVVARSTTSGSGFADIATVGANVTSYADNTVSPATTYFYRVRATNLGGASGNSNQASATTLPLPPAAPSGLSATAAGSSQINLSWTDNANNETNIVVARSTTSGGPYSDIATLAANSTSYNNTGLSAATTYYYVVRATNAGGASANSNQASATTQASIPATPTGLTATASGSLPQINLTWTDNANNETGYVVARSLTSGGAYTDVATLGANTTSYLNTGLAFGTTYHYVVRATSGGGSSPNSNQASATTIVSSERIIDNPAATIVGTWTLATSSADKYGADYRFKGKGTGTAWLEFNPGIGNQMYQVYEWHAQGTNRTTAAPHVIVHNGGTSTVNVNQQSNGGKWNLLGTYTFPAGGTGNVRITDAFPVSGQVVMADAIRFVLVPPPAAPSALTATAVSPSQINLSWTDNSSNESNFIISRGTTAGGPYTDIATVGANVKTYNNTGLAGNTRYYYRVRASNAAGSSANSNEANALTWPADIIVDNADAAFSASVNWATATFAADKFGSNYRYRPTTAISDAAVWNVNIPQTRNYQVYAWWSAGSNRSTSAPYIMPSGSTVNKNQQVNGGSWQSLGTQNVSAGARTVKLSCWTTTGFTVIADAVKLSAR